MKQTTLDADLQRIVREQLELMYPEHTDLTAPLFIALPAGIHPYNRATGYYDAKGNAIVAYQALGRHTLQGDVDLEFIRHELAHWHQYWVQEFTSVSKTNTHRHRTWREACYQASVHLWPEAGLEPWMFSPTTSKRVDGKTVSIQKPGAMTDVELHHWPREMATFLSRFNMC